MIINLIPARHEIMFTIAFFLEYIPWVLTAIKIDDLGVSVQKNGIFASRCSPFANNSQTDRCRKRHYQEFRISLMPQRQL